MNIKEEIERLKKEKDIMILSHYYVSGDIQDVSDIVGDSFQLAKDAQNSKNKIICLCGVHFMGESVKILNPEKDVIVPDLGAGCAMADMVNSDDIDKIKKKYDDITIVSYVNTTASVKSKSDVCVTSSNAEKIISKLESKNIYFLPDKNLGTYISKQIPDKNFIMHPGYCKYHNNVDYDEVKEIKKNTGYDILVHPECQSNILELADCIGSTKMLLNYVNETKKDGYIVCTEEGILHKMKKASPNSIFISPKSMHKCSDMKTNTLEKLYKSLVDESPKIILDSDLSKKAYKPLKKMMELA